MPAKKLLIKKWKQCNYEGQPVKSHRLLFYMHVISNEKYYIQTDILFGSMSGFYFPSGRFSAMLTKRKLFG